MKYLFFAFIMLSLFSFLHSAKKDGYVRIERNDRVVVKPWNPMPLIFSSNHSGSSKDNKTLSWGLDTSGLLTLKYRISGVTPSPKEVDVAFMYGELLSKDGLLTAKLSGYKKKTYIFKVAQNGVVDSFTNEVQLKISAKTLDNSICPLWYQKGFSSFSLLAIPTKASFKDKSKAKHEAIHCSEFTEIEIVDSKGKKGIYGSGDWCIISADRFVELKE